MMRRLNEPQPHRHQCRDCAASFWCVRENIHLARCPDCYAHACREMPHLVGRLR